MNKVFNENGIYFENCDCMERLKETPDKYYDLLLADLPYGDGNVGGGGYGEVQYNRFGARFNKYKRPHNEWTTVRRLVQPIQTPCQNVASSGGGYHGKMQHGDTTKCIAWDVAPDQEFINELFRVSKNQIFWGGNYFDLPPTRCFVVWRKINIPIKGFSMSPVEYAWTSFNQNAVVIEAHSGGNAKNVRWHPTQKPISLYEELLQNFAKKGDKILDPTAGSASSLVACYRMGFEATGFEIDEFYYDKAVERLNEEMAQVRLGL